MLKNKEEKQMADKYAVITREKMASEFDGTLRVAVKIDEELQNGSVVVVGSSR